MRQLRRCRPSVGVVVVVDSSSASSPRRHRRRRGRCGSRRPAPISGVCSLLLIVAHVARDATALPLLRFSRHAGNPRPAAPRPEHVEPREPVHRVARRAAHAPGRGGGGQRRAGDGRRRAALRRRPHVGAHPGRRHRTTSPSPSSARCGCRCSVTGGSTSATTARCRASTSGRPPSGTAPSRPSCGGAATTSRRRPSPTTAPSIRRTTGATGRSLPRCSRRPSASPTSSRACSPTGRT